MQGTSKYYTSLRNGTLIKENGITQYIKVQMHIFIVFEFSDIFKYIFQ
jgi:hypothetical protein